MTKSQRDVQFAVAEVITSVIAGPEIAFVDLEMRNAKSAKGMVSYSQTHMMIGKMMLGCANDRAHVCGAAIGRTI